ncbi:MAG: Na+/H+ antiporter subunit D [Burkholderiaceae bacterium]|nr:Na+/H+ antiporter subunit D [Burkholderiaceae bacterium]
MTALATAPVLVPLVTAGLTAMVAGRARLQQAISLAGALVFLAVALVLVGQLAAGGQPSVSFGGWQPPYGIQFELDRLSGVLVLVTALMGVSSLLFLISDADPGPRHPLLLPLLHGTLAGVAGAFSTADLFNLYVWFEVMLICALGLIALGGRRDQLDAAFKYLGLNLFGTLLLLAAVGLVYAVTGHLNYAALAASAWRVDPALLNVLLVTLSLALLLKSAAFPLYAWLPASYPSLPAPVLALFAGLLTKVGVYAVMRTLGDVFAPAASALYEGLGWVAVATMVAGVLGAAYHWDMRRILAFHIISQIGYILLAVALGGVGGHAAALFYTVHHIVVKANLFLIAGMAACLAGSYDLRRVGGLAAARPALALLFAVPALSLVGIPPLSGFWAKLLVLQEAFVQQRYAWASMGLLVSVLTLYSMMKIWLEAFWKPHPQATADAPWHPRGVALTTAWVSTVVLAAVTLAIGLAPQPLLAYAQDAALALGRR